MCDDGVMRSLDITAEATSPFGCVYQQRLRTPRGEGATLGVSDEKLYVLLDEMHQSLIATGFTREEFAAGRLQTIPDAPIEVTPVDSHRVKHGIFCGRHVSIVTQDYNGPCPLLAVANALALAGRIQLCDGDCRRVEGVHVRHMLLNHATANDKPVAPRFTSAPTRVVDGVEVSTLAGMVKERLEEVRSYLAQENEGEKTMRRLYYGMNISPSFCGVDCFEAESDVMLFALSGLRVVHGWFIPAESPFAALREMSFNEVSVIATKSDSPLSDLAGEFLRSTQSQLTEAGLEMLRQDLCEGEVVVLFWNNHFSTVVKLNGRLLLLLSDETYADKSAVFFQTIEDAYGAATFTDGNGRDADGFLLAVQSLTGNDFSDEDINAAKSEIRNETDAEPSPQVVVDYLKRKRRSQRAAEKGKVD